RFAHRFGHRLERHGLVQNAGPGFLEVALFAQTEMPLGNLEREGVVCEQLFDLGELENVELALLALGIGVQGRKEPTLLALHFRKEPAGNLPRRISKKRLAERSM